MCDDWWGSQVRNDEKPTGRARWTRGVLHLYHLSLSLSLRRLQKVEGGGAKHATVHLITINKIIGREEVPSTMKRRGEMVGCSAFSQHMKLWCPEMPASLHKWLPPFLPIIWSFLKGSAKRWSSGLMNFVPALAYRICLALPVAFTQPRARFLLMPCTGTFSR